MEVPRPLMPNIILVGGINCNVRNPLPEVRHVSEFRFFSYLLAAFSAGRQRCVTQPCVSAGFGVLGVGRARVCGVHFGQHGVRHARKESFRLPGGLQTDPPEGT